MESVELSGTDIAWELTLRRYIDGQPKTTWLLDILFVFPLFLFHFSSPLVRYLVALRFQQVFQLSYNTNTDHLSVFPCSG